MAHGPRLPPASNIAHQEAVMPALKRVLCLDARRNREHLQATWGQPRWLEPAGCAKQHSAPSMAPATARQSRCCRSYRRQVGKAAPLHDGQPRP